MARTFRGGGEGLGSGSGDSERAGVPSGEEGGRVADERHDAAFVVGAVLGGVAGAAYTLLNAPQSGGETRAELAARWSGLADRLAAEAADLDGAIRRLTAGAGTGARSVTERLRPDRGETTIVTAEVGVAASSEEAEPVFTLPDPLEPDPIVRDEPADGSAGDDPGGARSEVGTRDVDVVIEGPRPLDAPR